MFCYAKLKNVYVFSSIQGNPSIFPVPKTSQNPQRYIFDWSPHHDACFTKKKWSTRLNYMCSLSACNIGEQNKNNKLAASIAVSAGTLPDLGTALDTSHSALVWEAALKTRSTRGTPSFRQNPLLMVCKTRWIAGVIKYRFLSVLALIIFVSSRPLRWPQDEAVGYSEGGGCGGGRQCIHPDDIPPCLSSCTVRKRVPKPSRWESSRARRGPVPPNLWPGRSIAELSTRLYCWLWTGRRYLRSTDP